MVRKPDLVCNDTVLKAVGTDVPDEAPKIILLRLKGVNNGTEAA